MSLTLEAMQYIRQRVNAETRMAKIQLLLKTLWSYLAQHKGAPSLQFVAFSALSTTSVVLADAACKLYAVYFKKPAASTVSAFLKLTDNATTASTNAPDILCRCETTEEDVVIFPDGKAMANGLTGIACTTANGGTTSAAADRPSGFVIIGAV